MKYIESDKIKVYPCTYRGAKVEAEGRSLIDPEARLNTEDNFAVKKYAKRAIGNAEDSYLISWETGKNPKLKCMIAGYYFEINQQPEDFVDKGTPQVLYVILTDVDLRSNSGVSSTTKILQNLKDNSNQYLDGANEGTTNYFFGLGICTEDELRKQQKQAIALAPVYVDTDGNVQINWAARTLDSVLATGKKAGSIHSRVLNDDTSVTSGDKSLLESTVDGKYAIAFGNGTTVNGDNSVGIGNKNIVVGANNFVFGNNNNIGQLNNGSSEGIAVDNVFVFGHDLTATSSTLPKVLIGNKNKDAEDYIIEIANGENLFTVTNAGDVEIAGSLTIDTKLNVEEDTTINGDLTVGVDDSTIPTQTTVDNLKTRHDLEVTGTATVKGNIVVSKTATIGKKLTVNSEGIDVKKGSLTVTDGTFSATYNENSISCTSSNINLKADKTSVTVNQSNISSKVSNGSATTTVSIEPNRASVDLNGKAISLANTDGNLGITCPGSISAESLSISDTIITVDSTGITTSAVTTNDLTVTKATIGTVIAETVTLNKTEDNKTITATIDASGLSLASAGILNNQIWFDSTDTKGNPVTFKVIAGANVNTGGIITTNGLSITSGEMTIGTSPAYCVKTTEAGLKVETESGSVLTVSTAGITVPYLTVTSDKATINSATIMAPKCKSINIGNGWINGSTVGGLTISTSYVEITGNTIATNPSFKLKNGYAEAPSFNATSDIRKKTNIESFTPTKSILDLDVKKFEFKEDLSHKQYIGCIAQDLQEICPEIVDSDEEGYLSVQESKLVYLLLEEVKKLRSELDYIKKEK